MKKKITITNAYTWYNKGDAGILLGIVSSLKKQYGEENIEINILSFSPELDKSKYCEDKCIKNVYSNCLNPYPYKQTKVGKIFAMIKLVFNMCSLYMKSKVAFEKTVKKNPSLKVLNDSDIIVVCGGGFLGGKKYDSLMHVFQVYLDTLFNKPVIVMGTSIEPMDNGLIKKKTESVLKKVDFVFARERITYDYLKTFLPKNKFALIPDMAFMLDEKEKDFPVVSNIRKKADKVIGITVRKWKFPNSKNSNESMINYKNVIAKVMTKYIRDKNFYFVFIPQVIVSTGDDTIIAREIRELLDASLQDHFIIVDDDLSPMDIKSLIGCMDYFIGTRMHSNIFATSMKVPTTAIAYEKKTNGIMETVNLANYVVEIDTISENELESKIDKMISNSDEITKNLNKTIPELKDKIKQEINNAMNKY